MRSTIIGLIVCCFFAALPCSNAEAVLQFDSAIPLTLGLPGDNPDITGIAYNAKHDEYLVVYQYRNEILQFPTQIHAARLSSTGEYIANYIISDLPNDCRQPDVAYDPLLDRYLVVWSYDTSTPADGPYWDIYGRFVPWSGPVDYLPGFEIANGVNECGNCFHTPVDESAPRIAYSSANRDFLVVMSVSWQGNASYIQGYRVSIDGSSHWKNLLVGSDNVTPYGRPDVAYNSFRDEFLLVFDRDGDIFSLTVPGQQAFGDYADNPVGVQQINMLDSSTPLTGTHQQPTVSFHPSSRYYLITWISNKHIGYGDLYARYLPGGSVQPTNAVYLEKLDPANTWAEYGDVSCSSDSTHCLVVWALNNNGVFYTYGRQIYLGSDFASGFLTSKATGFAGPLDNLSAVTAWGSTSPWLSIASGTGQYGIGYTGIGTNDNRYAFSRLTDIPTPAGWYSIAAGGGHVLGIRHDEPPRSMWANTAGQLGLGHRSPRARPTLIESTGKGYTVGAGDEHSLAIARDGTLWAWGRNNYGQLGTNDPIVEVSYPQRVWAGTSWNTVAGGANHTLGIRSDGALYSWGLNNNYQLGLGDSAPRDFPARVGQDNDWIAVAAGRAYSLAIRSDHSLWAWGDNYFGQLGFVTDFGTDPARVGTGNNWVAISAGDYHSLGITANGHLWSWGYNYNGQLGLGDQNDRNQPTPVGTASNWKAVAAGSYHSLGIRLDGSLYAWGENSSGQLGVGDKLNRTTPTRVGTAADWVAVSAASAFSLGIRSDGTLWVWGWCPGGPNGMQAVLEPQQVTMTFPWNLFLPSILHNKGGSGS